MAINNNYEKKSVTTSCYHTSNSRMVKATALSWDFSDDMIKISISPELPESEQTENRRYDYKNSWITAIKRVKCMDLLNRFKEIVAPAIESQKDSFISVPVAEVNQFGLGVHFDDNGIHTYIKLVRNIDPTNLTSQAEIVYEFKKGEVIVNYDNATGKFEERLLKETEFELFLSDMAAFVNAGSNAYNHSNRVVDRFYKDTLTTMLRSIGEKVGAEMPTYNAAQKAGAKYGGASLFDSNAAQAPVSTITSLNDIQVDQELPF